MIYSEIFYELDEILLENKKPSDGIIRLIREGKFNKEPLDMIKKLENIEQSKKYHPEGNVLNHILLVVDQASKVKEMSKDKRVFMWSSLLHDIGKLTTTRKRKDRITSYDHDVEGEIISLKILDALTDDMDFKIGVSKMVRYHMQPLFFDKNMPFFKPNEMLSEVDYKEVALLSLCDRLGRGGLSKEDTKYEKQRIEKFVNNFEAK